MKLFLDDRRKAPEGFILFREVSELERFLLENADKVSVISVDYELNALETGLDFAVWLEEMVFTGRLKLKRDVTLVCHSSDLLLRQKIEEIFEGIKAFLRSGS